MAIWWELRVIMCGVEEERVVCMHKAPGACPRCGGTVVATDVESDQRILCLRLCLKSNHKYSYTMCFHRLVTLVS
jgi:ribosomal protein S27AE